VLRISILPSNFSKMGGVCLNFAFLDDNFLTRRFSSKFPTTQNSGGLEAVGPRSASSHDATGLSCG